MFSSDYFGITGEKHDRLNNLKWGSCITAEQQQNQNSVPLTYTQNTRVLFKAISRT